jgi:hypothetical protein
MLPRVTRVLSPRFARALRARRGFRAASLILLALALLWAPASIAATPADTAATYAFLQARYQLSEAILQNAPASRSAATTLIEHLGKECQGVLAGAPKEAVGPPSERSATATPRASGERQRSELQLQTIQEELALSLSAAIYGPDRAAAEAYAAQVARLSWSDPRIAPLVSLDVRDLEEHLSPPVADVCADMKAWAQSGYHTLAAPSREFAVAQKARAEATKAVAALDSLLSPYEGPTERRLIRRTQTLAKMLSTTLAGDLRGFSHLQRALGVPESPFETIKQEPVLGRGTTEAGGSFVVRRETAGEQFGSHCKHALAIEITERSKGSQDFSEGSSTSVCLGGRPERQPSGECSGEVQSITFAVPASVRSAQLLLSNGRTITSRVVRIPRRYGGPGGVYVQAVRGYSPYPISLTELDAKGDVVRVVQLKLLRCHREPPEKRPTFVKLAQGATPEGEPFTIEGIAFEFGGHSSFNLELDAGLPARRNVIEVGSAAKPKAFPWSLGMECPPHEFAIVYGILSAPGDSVMARTSAGLVPLTKVAIAADLHSKGPLVYGVFATLPSELVVLRSDGSTLYTESLAARGTEEAEFCAGYAEG